MVAFAVCIVSFPALMSQWPGVGLQADVRRADRHHSRPGAADRRDDRRDPARCAEDRAETRRGEQSTSPTLLANQDIFGNFAGRGWEWVPTGYLLGGLWLWQRRIITWHVPVAFIGGLAVDFRRAVAVQSASSPTRCSICSRAAPCWAPSSSSPIRCPAARRRRGKLIFGACAGLLAYIIRVFGGYPDGVAFAVLLMNLCVPLIDMLYPAADLRHERQEMTLRAEANQRARHGGAHGGRSCWSLSSSSPACCPAPTCGPGRRSKPPPPKKR